MTNRNYVNGSNFERKVKKEWEELGYLCFRTAGSHGQADIIAIDEPNGVTENGVTCLIQCKISNKISKEEILNLRTVAKRYNCYATIAYREKEGRKYVTKYEEVYDPDD